MGDRLRAGKPPGFVTSHIGQLSLLLPAGGRKISTGQGVVTRDALQVCLVSHVDKRAGGG